MPTCGATYRCFVSFGWPFTNSDPSCRAMLNPHNAAPPCLQVEETDKPDVHPSMPTVIRIGSPRAQACQGPRRFRLATDTLAVRLTLLLAGCVEDSHLQASAPAGRTKRKGRPCQTAYLGLTVLLGCQFFSPFDAGQLLDSFRFQLV